MSGVITALVVSTAATVYSVEETRKAKSEADDRLRDDKKAIAKEREFTNQKKKNNDILSSNKAAMLREQARGKVGGPMTQDESLGLLGLPETSSQKKTGGI